MHRTLVSRGGTLILAAALLAGCDPWGSGPRVRLRPEAPAAELEDWTWTVAAGAGLWTGWVGPGCPAPFEVAPDDPDAHPVRLVPKDEWPRPGALGTTYYDGGGRIEVRGGLQDGGLHVLSHELGHVLLGRGHSPDGLMAVRVASADREPTPEDIDHARDALGCGEVAP